MSQGLNELTLASLENAIRRAVNDEVARVTKKHMDAARSAIAEELDRAVPELIAGITLRLAKNFSIVQMRDELAITVSIKS